MEGLKVVETNPSRLLLEKAREYCKEFSAQRRWYPFAQCVHEIRSNKDFEISYPSFQAYCEKELPQVNYSTISKLCSIAEFFGDRLKRACKKKEFVVPAYEALYTLLCAMDRIEEKEFDLLVDSVFAGTMGYHPIRKRVNELLAKHRARIHLEVDSSTDEIEKQLMKDLGEDDEEELLEEELETPAATTRVKGLITVKSLMLLLLEEEDWKLLTLLSSKMEELNADERE